MGDGASGDGAAASFPDADASSALRVSAQEQSSGRLPRRSGRTTGRGSARSLSEWGAGAEEQGELEQPGVAAGAHAQQALQGPISLPLPFEERRAALELVHAEVGEEEWVQLGQEVLGAQRGSRRRGAELLELMGAWRPDGWSWQHDMWITDHVDGLDLTRYVRQLHRAVVDAAEAAGLYNSTSSSSSDAGGGSSGPVSLEPKHLAHLAGFGKPRVAPDTFLAYSLDRSAMGAAGAMRSISLRKQAEAEAARRKAAEVEAGAAGVEAAEERVRGRRLAVSEPVPGTRLSSWSNVALLEAWLDGIFRGKNYRSLRICANFRALTTATTRTCYKYTVLCNPVSKQTPTLTNLELYDLAADPWEIRDRSRQPWSEPHARLMSRLNAVLTVMSYCSGATCRNPFLRIHPDGRVVNLDQAMETRYDDLYSKFKTFTYNRCSTQYIATNEDPDPYLAGYTETMPV